MCPLLSEDTTMNSTTYCNTTVDLLRTFTAKIYPYGYDRFQQKTAPCNCALSISNWFKEHELLLVSKASSVLCLESYWALVRRSSKINLKYRNTTSRYAVAYLTPVKHKSDPTYNFYYGHGPTFLKNEISNLLSAFQEEYFLRSVPMVDHIII